MVRIGFDPLKIGSALEEAAYAMRVAAKVSFDPLKIGSALEGFRIAAACGEPRF